MSQSPNTTIENAIYHSVFLIYHSVFLIYHSVFLIYHSVCLIYHSVFLIYHSGFLSNKLLEFMHRLKALFRVGSCANQRECFELVERVWRGGKMPFQIGVFVGEIKSVDAIE